VSLPRTPSFRLDGRRALVTGASRGIGFACAAALAEAGADVTLAARSPEPLAVAAETLVRAGRSARAAPLDVADLDALGGFFAERPPFDILCNSAGIARHGPALETRVEDFDAVAAVNLRGAYFLAREAAKGMAVLGGGAIIQVSSQMGHVGGPDRAVYCATKHGVEGMTRAMAIEWGAMGIRVNTVCPTFIRTPLTEPTLRDPEKLAWIEGKIRLGRLGEVEDVMGAVVFLASDAAAMITGTSLLVDGGWTAG
jgi:2-deoxy-D-gluconate 3-dehydrogenase